MEMRVLVDFEYCVMHANNFKVLVGKKFGQLKLLKLEIYVYKRKQT